MSTFDPVVADEAARERDYNKALQNRAQRVQQNSAAIVRNTWTTEASLVSGTKGELFGRVALREANHEFLDGAKDFYIGSAHHEEEDYSVFSWAAPISCTFFRKSSSHHELCTEVSGVRVLVHRAGTISDYQDEQLDDTDAIDPLFPRAALTIPKAPHTALPVAEKGAGAQEPPTQSPADGLNDHHAHQPRPAQTAGSEISDPIRPGSAFTAPSASAVKQVPPGPALRTPELLLRQLAAPKAPSMTSVLATIQSDQFDAITKPVADHQVIQGHPGTGKTIIGTHRAAYLLNPEAPPEARPRKKILILGPTAEYVTHVQNILRDLIPDSTKYVVKALPQFLDELAGLPPSDRPTESVVLETVSLELARLVDAALARTKGNLEGEKPSDDDVYAELLWLLHEPPNTGLDREWVQYLRNLPKTLSDLKKQRVASSRGLLAYIGVRTNPPWDPGHVIVDEAQDIHPIEWEVLGRIGNIGGWTILGDMNQRRTDHTFGSWDDIARILAIENGDDEAPVQVLERGYRSTAQIIRFANQLLPARDRTIFSLQQEGEPPLLRRVTSLKALHRESVQEAENLRQSLPRGTVALITIDPRMATDALKKTGWVAEAGKPNVWSKGAAEISVLPPDRSRGLEFDGVVVVEPQQFPQNLGRNGLLYTALTRANRRLTVIHHARMPQGLKAIG